ncbi:23S rRNA (pseudouridine(1915)-N(3))-methyltransferase RlmH [Croceivirga thetidis]|uniref:Ribosomal RNA large subunit methyltransferase H n=1 Tax=Croceivirga thetidis TaxID=2721623 RepID=A0ABX1GU77_9FLAO|nr:23S rRNA (pseudouridine(1915)-N(3))-methyltransferase RlmH [Croceivirga thetidis]NKI32606.1 23S rRNA (pseudouridine(1915)-N(3))-methyltransferase RlmH [Croceivirga thetidis]
MKIKIIAIGRTDDHNLKQLNAGYLSRLKHYAKVELIEIPDLKKVKNLSKDQQKIKEGELILNNLEPSDVLVLFDEKGKQFSSREFSNELQKRMNSGIKSLVFAIGGPYGFSEEVYIRAQQKISLSRMTFSHQMVRVFILEQLYRGFSILRNEPYHHD